MTANDRTACWPQHHGAGQDDKRMANTPAPAIPPLAMPPLAIPTLDRTTARPATVGQRPATDGQGVGKAEHDSESAIDMTEAEPPEDDRIYHLRLIVAGSTPRSRRAIENLQRVCDEHLRGRADVEVIDLYQQPELALKYQAVAAPTLVKLLPLPLRRVVGDLSNEATVLRGLDISISVGKDDRSK